jgi:hypothetical protein
MAQFQTIAREGEAENVSDTISKEDGEKCPTLPENTGRGRTPTSTFCQCFERHPLVSGEPAMGSFWK